MPTFPVTAIGILDVALLDAVPLVEGDFVQHLPQSIAG